MSPEPTDADVPSTPGHQLVLYIRCAAGQLLGRLRQGHHCERAFYRRKQRWHFGEPVYIPLCGYVVDNCLLDLLQTIASFGKYRRLRMPDNRRNLGGAAQLPALARSTHQVFIDLQQRRGDPKQHRIIKRTGCRGGVYRLDLISNHRTRTFKAENRQRATDLLEGRRKLKQYLACTLLGSDE